MRLIFLKLGGSAITDKTREATTRLDVIRNAARAIANVCAQKPDFKILLGHGSGSFGHFAAQESGFGQPDNWRAYAETGAAAARLNRIVTDILLEENIPVVSIQPSASARCRDGELQSLEVAPVRAALDHNLIPLLYGDVALDDIRGMTIVSTDALFAYLAALLHPTRIIYATAVNGIYTADPALNPDARLLSAITPGNFPAIRFGVGAAQGVDVTGGMLDKLSRAVALVAKLPSLEIHIIAARPDLIERALLEENFAEGTRITAK